MSKLFHKQQHTQEHGQHQNQNVEDCNKSSVDWKKQNLAVVEDGRNKGVAKIFFENIRPPTVGEENKQRYSHESMYDSCLLS